MVHADSRPTETLRPDENGSEAAFEPTARVVLPERLLTVREVAARLGVCRATVYSLVERGELPHVRVSNAVRFHPEDVSAFMRRSG